MHSPGTPLRRRTGLAPTMSDLPARPELKIEELTAYNIDLVRERLLTARSFEESVEVESYLDTLWSVADTELRDGARRSASRYPGVNMQQVHRLLQFAHDSAAVDKLEVAANALADAARCLPNTRRGEDRDGNAD
jgi:hypothetical protein